MKNAQAGATTVELAFVLLTFFMFLLGVIDVSRMLYTWNAATEATRAGARYAVVCASPGNVAAVTDKMRRMLPEIGAVNLAWDRAPCASCAVPPACTAGDTSGCAGVTVTITSLNYHWISPLIGIVVPNRALPSFSTYLPREMMGQDANNAIICQ
jgi:Flp pilus assembly protein TadG